MQPTSPLTARGGGRDGRHTPLQRGATMPRRFSVPTPHTGHGLSVGALKWGLVKHLYNEGVLVYSLREREHVKLQAELRNSSATRGAWNDRLGGCTPREEGHALPWYLIDDDGAYKRAWDLLLTVMIVYSVIVTPFRLGFAVEAADGWALLVRPPKNSLRFLKLVSSLPSVCVIMSAFVRPVRREDCLPMM